MLFIFDMGGVVTSTFDMNILYDKLNINKKYFMALCTYSDRNLWKLLELGKISVDFFWEKFNDKVSKLQRTDFEGFLRVCELPEYDEDFRVHDIPEVVSDFFRMYFHPQRNTEVVELINNLRKKHRVVCGTNTIQSHWENHLERGDYACFDQTYPSNKMGIAKPDKLFFEIIMQAENFKPNETFFVDDKIENVEAAKKCGINAVLFKDAQTLINEWKQYYE